MKKVNISLLIFSFLLFSNLVVKAISISYAILTHNETKSLRKLLRFIIQNKDDNDEIVILDDYSSNPKTLKILDKYSSHLKIYKRNLNLNFSDQRNFLKKLCTKNYIFFIDSDEIPATFFIKNLKKIISENYNIEAFALVRAHIIHGLPNSFGQLNSKGFFAWPDYQVRVVKNIDTIFWENNVHEVLVGFKSMLKLPEDENYGIIEEKNYSEKTFNNKQLFYDKVYKNWLREMLTVNEKERIKNILYEKPKLFLPYLLEQDFLEILKRKNNFHKISKYIKYLINKKNINFDDINVLINLL